jgi:hypothetical protein
MLALLCAVCGALQEQALLQFVVAAGMQVLISFPAKGDVEGIAWWP